MTLPQCLKLLTVYTPRGEVVVTAGEEEVILYSDVDLNLLDSIREQIPVSKQKRHDIYQVVESNN